MMEFEIRAMASDDVAAVAAIERECFSLPWSEKSLLSELSRHDAVALTALSKGKAVGWAGFEYVCGEGSVTNVAVTAAARRCGVGAALVAALIEKAKTLRLQSLTLEVRASNSGAIALYERLGFALIGRRPGFYERPREDALIFSYLLFSEESGGSNDENTCH